MKNNLSKIFLVVALSFSSLVTPIAQSTRIYADTSVGIDFNGDLSETEKGPMDGPWDPTHMSSDTYQDGAMWENNIKPVGWNFQMWKPTATPENFKAAVIEKEGKNFVHVDVSNKTSADQSFLKRMNIPVTPNTTYELTALIELLNITSGTLKIRVEQSGGSKFDFTIGSGVKEMDIYDLFFKSGNASSINIIVLMDQSSRGSYVIGDLKINEYLGEVRSIEMDTEQQTVELGSSTSLVAKLLPAAATDKTVNWSSSDTSIATVNSSGIVSALQEGTVTITACANSDASICKQKVIEIQDGSSLPTSASIEIENNLELGDHRLPTFTQVPVLSKPIQDASWTVSNDNAEITEKGWLKVLKIGTFDLTLTLEDPKLDNPIVVTKTITVEPDATEEDYLKIRDQWIERIIGSENAWTKGNESIDKYLDKLDKESLEYWESMHTQADRETNNSLQLWDNYAQETAAAHMTTQFRKLHVLTKAFTTSTTTLYQDPEVFKEIIGGFDYMLDVKKYGDYGTYSGNWWDWQIGSAQPFSESLLLLDTYLESPQTIKYAKAIERYVWDPSKQISGAHPGAINATGANRGDIGLSTLAVGVLLEKESMINLIPATIPDIWKYVTSGDGFYRDGSFIQHSKIAYTGSYGVELIRSVSALVAMTEGTRWELSSSQNFDNLNSIIPDSYLPIVQNGQMMAMLMGRSVSRAPGLNKYAPAFSGGAELAANLLIISPSLSESTSKQVQEHVKSWMIGASPYYDYIENARDFEMLENLIQLEENTTITAKVNPISQFYGLMARGIYRSDNFTAGISFTNYRIANYEGGVGSGAENKKGWHTGDGMLYLYNDDPTMFGDSYWPTVDFYRLPGITVDTRPVADNENQGKISSNQRWAGGASKEGMINTGFVFDKSKQSNLYDLKAKKSYFIIGDQVVLLGSDIQGTSISSIETIIENRILNEDSSKRVLLNGESTDSIQEVVTLGDWVYLEGKEVESSFGYVFLNDASIYGDKVTRTGSYNDINGVFGNDTMYEAEYFTMGIDHGTTAQDERYAYIVLPGKTLEETESYSANNPIQILIQNKQAHAIYDNSSKTIMINYFDASAPLVLDNLEDLNMGIESLEISGGTGASIIITLSANGKLEYTISNPNMDGKVTNVLAKMPGVSLVEDETNISDEVIILPGDNFKLQYNSDGRPGTSWSVAYDLNLNLETLSNIIASLEELNFTKTSWTTIESTQVLEEVQAYLDGSKVLTQKDIDNLVIKLNSYIESLVPAGNFNAVDTVVNGIQSSISDYTEYSIEILEAKLETLTELKEERAEQSTIDAYLVQLREVVESLELNLTIEDIDEWVSQNPVEEMDYTLESYTTYQEKLEAYKELIDKYDPTKQLVITQEEVDFNFASLEQAYTTLVSAGSFEEVNKIVEEVELNHAKYTSYSYNLFTSKVSEIEELQKQRVSQSIIDSYLDELSNLISSLEETLDIKDMNEWMDNHNISKEKYTKESYTRYEQALAKYTQLAQAYDPTKALTISQEELDTAYKELEEAYAGLSVINENNNQDGNKKPDAKETPDTSIKEGLPTTGVGIEYTVVLGIALLAIGFIVLISKKKSRR